MATYRVPVLDEFSWQPPVIDKDLTAPPGGESKGDRYIVGAEATGDWSGLDTHIVTYNGSGWIDSTPAEGWYVYIEDENISYLYDGAAWGVAFAAGGDITSIDTRVGNVESSVGSINTRCDANESDISTNSAAISTNAVAIASNALIGDSNASSIVSIDTRATNIESSVGSIDTNLTGTDSSVASIDTHVDSCDSSIVSIDTRATNIESSVGSINTVVGGKQDVGVYVSEYGAIEFTI